MIPLKPQEVALVMVRHGQAFAEDGSGEGGPGLNPLGRIQAQRVARRLAGERFDHIYASDLARAMETAEAICCRHPHTPHTPDRRLREVDTWLISPGRLPRRKGLAETLARQKRAVERFCRHLKRRHRAGQCILVVAHGNLIRLMIWLMFGVNPRTRAMIRTYNASVSIMTFREGGGDERLLLANCVKHLSPSQVTNWADEKGKPAR